MDNLTEIAEKYGTDKSSHGYTSFYNSIFSDYRDIFDKVCEIGIKHGASINMWVDYFINADVYGIDAIEEMYANLPDHERVFGFFGNQSNRDDMSNFHKEYGDDFDLILDDGCHQTKHQQIALGSMFPLVRSGGFYVVEDINCCLDPHYAKEDGSDAILNALLHLHEHGTLGSFASYMTDDERKYVENNFDDILFYSQSGTDFRRGTAATAVVIKK